MAWLLHNLQQRAGVLLLAMSTKRTVPGRLKSWAPRLRRRARKLLRGLQQRLGPTSGVAQELRSWTGQRQAMRAR